MVSLTRVTVREKMITYGQGIRTWLMFASVQNEKGARSFPRLYVDSTVGIGAGTFGLSCVRERVAYFEFGISEHGLYKYFDRNDSFTYIPDMQAVAEAGNPCSSSSQSGHIETAFSICIIGNITIFVASCYPIIGTIPERRMRLVGQF